MAKTKKHQANVETSVPVPAIRASPARRELTKSADFFSIYTNDVLIHTSPWDVRLVLGEIGDVQAPTVVNVRLLGELRISPQLAKKVAMLMIEQLKIYEARFGEIPGIKD